MKKFTYISLVIVGLVFAHLSFAAPTSTLVQNLFITALGGTGNPCLVISNTAGLVATSTSCGSGGGGGGVGTSSPTTGLAFFVNGNTISGTSTYVVSIASGTYISASNSTGTVILNFINPGFLSNASITAVQNVTWSGANVIGFSNPGFVTSASSVTWTATIFHNASTSFNASTTFASTTFMPGLSGIIAASSSNGGQLFAISIGGGLSFTNGVLSSTQTITNLNQLINGPGYITTSSITFGGVASNTFQVGLKLTMSATGTLGLATSAISQWNNDVGFITSAPASTTLNGATSSANTIVGGTYISISDAASTTNSTHTINFVNTPGFLNNASITATYPVLWSGTNVISWGGLSTSSNLVAGQWIVAASGNQIYSTSSQPAITINGASPISVTAISATGTAIVSCATCITTSTWVVNASGTNIVTYNQGGSSTIGFNMNPTLSSLAVSGNVTSTSFTSTSTANSQIQYLNNAEWVPANFNAIGCAGKTGDTDFGTCINDLYALASTTASSVAIMVPDIIVTPAQWKQPINFNINKLIPNLICPGGAQLQYGGTGTAATFDFNVGGAHDVSQDWGCTYMGSSTVVIAGATSTATTTGILFGGSSALNPGGGGATTSILNAANGVDFHDNNINGFGTCVVVASNTYMLNFKDNSVTGCGTNPVSAQPYPGALFNLNKANNSGEKINVEGNNFTDPANSTATNAVYLADNGGTTSFFSHNSFDDAGIYVGISSIQVDFEENHFENSAPATYPGYYFIVASSSGATTMIVDKNYFANDANAAFGNSKGIEHAVNLTFSNNEVNKNGNQTITNFLNHDINPGQAVETFFGDWSQNGAVSNWPQLSGTTYPEYGMESANGYPFIITTTGGSLGTFINGQQNVATVDSNGNWQFGPTSVTASGTLTVVQTSTLRGELSIGTSTNPSGGLFYIATTSQILSVSSTGQVAILSNNLVDANGNKYSTSTGGGGGGNNATGTVGYAAYFTSVNNLSSSTLYGSSTFAIGTTTLNAGYGLFVLGSTASSSGGTEITVMNTATTSFSEFVATMDNGATNTNFGGLGINNSQWSGGIEKPGDLFIEASSSGGIDIETQSGTIRFFIGGVAQGTTANNLFFTIASTTVTAQTGFTQSGGTNSFASSTFAGYLSVGTTTVSGTLFIATTTSILNIFGTGQVMVNSNNLTDAGGTKYVTSTSAGSGTVTTSTLVTANYFPFWNSTGGSGLNGTSSLYRPSLNDLTIGSTSDNGLFSIVNASNTVVLQVASTTNPSSSAVLFNVVATSSIFQLLASGHINATGTIPTMGTCGSSPNVTGTDAMGTIGVGTGVVTSCTLNFQIPYETINYQCVASDNSAAISTAITSQTTGTVTFGTSATLGGGKIYYFCGENL